MKKTMANDQFLRTFGVSALAWQVQGPEFGPQHRKKKKKKEP
jgi:hypothetical protein